MGVKKIGEIKHVTGGLEWTLPGYSDIPTKMELQLWSRKFAYINRIKYPNSDFINPNVVTLSFNKGNTIIKNPKTFISNFNHIKVKITSNVKRWHRPVLLRVGMIDKRNREINSSVCTWNTREEIYNANILIEDFELYRCLIGQHPNSFFRLFCEWIPSNSEDYADADTVIQAKVDGQDLLKIDLEALLFSQKDSDLIIKVQHREFNAHRCILRARSPVFDSMLSHDLTEKTQGLINIEDIEPKIFEDFLVFVYTGETEHITSDNVYGLYYASDKYNVQYLKTECVSYLKNAFSVENISTVICLATKHNEVQLLELAEKYFSENMQEILATGNWLQFLKDNPNEANELISKSLKHGYTKRDTL